jgi:hypothetical protein
MFSGGYSLPYNMLKVRRGILLGTAIILLIYALLPETLRFSRALILIGATWTLFISHMSRLLINLFSYSEFKTVFHRVKKRIVIVGEKNEAERVYSILKYSQIIPDMVGIVNSGDKNDDSYIGNVTQLREIIKINNIEEIIFCGKNISSQEIIRNMLLFSDEKIDFKIAPPESSSVIGSSSINTAGDLYTVSFNSVTKPSNRKRKRGFDITVALVLLIFSPLLLLIYKSRTSFLKNIFLVLQGKLTVVGYSLESRKQGENIIVRGVFYPIDIVKSGNLSHEASFRLNTEYAQNYNIQNDLNILMSNLLSFDRKPKK